MPLPIVSAGRGWSENSGIQQKFGRDTETLQFKYTGIQPVNNLLWPPPHRFRTLICSDCFDYSWLFCCVFLQSFTVPLPLLWTRLIQNDRLNRFVSCSAFEHSVGCFHNYLPAIYTLPVRMHRLSRSNLVQRLRARSFPVNANLLIMPHLCYWLQALGFKRLDFSLTQPMPSWYQYRYHELVIILFLCKSPQWTDDRTYVTLLELSQESMGPVRQLQQRYQRQQLLT